MLLTDLKKEFPEIPSQVFSTYIKELDMPVTKEKQRVFIVGDTSELYLKLHKYVWRNTKRKNTGNEKLTVDQVSRVLAKLDVKFTREYNGSGLNNYRADFKIENLLIEVKHNVTYHSVGQALFYRFLFDMDTIIVYGGSFDCGKTAAFAKSHNIKVLLPNQLKQELVKRKIIKP